ncbi:uncharacterized protein LOC100677839 isoform X2 [Nasonia vitripennis]|uniref:Uncharacterized protein n=1 Tax=Nasonia vitripennis TaxID=7425 RepID=A0A7M7GCX6_NASVI|nr:uncharacterized protein LOC100677839 isoform X2 [Nasonia vitripennis]
MLTSRISELFDGFRRYKEKIAKGCARMKYSPQQQQQQQKERKSESEMSSVNATPSRAASALQRSASAASQSSAAARRALTCRPLSTDMFAWMRVFRLANLLHQVGC